jgi:AcrR family transcriptional regulator
MEQTTPDLLKLAFDIVGERGWNGFSFVELSRRSDLSLTDVYAKFPNRGALLEALGARLDSAMLDLDLDELNEMSPRERVFELIMRRLDAMAPFKAGLAEVGRCGRGCELVRPAARNVGRAVTRLLDAAEAPMPSAVAAGARPVLTLIYSRVFNVWLKDDTPDLARTLSELDRRLQQAESLGRFLSRAAPGRSESRAAA